VDDHNPAPEGQIGTGTAQAPQKGTALRGDPTPYRKPWTEEETRILKKNWLKRPSKEILSLLPGRTYKSLQYRAQRIGVSGKRGKHHRLISSYVKEQTTGDLFHDDRVYLAAIIDGEGTITVIIENRRDGTLTPHISISGTDGNLLRWLKTRLRSGYYVREDKYPQRKPIWRVRIEGLLNVKILLEQIVQFLIVKRKQAELLLEFCNLRLEDRARERNPRLFEIAKEIRYLNRKGRT